MERQVSFSGGRRPPAEDSPPANWFAPVDFWHGQIHARFDVTQTIATRFGVEICLWQKDGDHNCLPLAWAPPGTTGPIYRVHAKAGVALLGSLGEADFKQPFDRRELRLFDLVDRTKDIPGPVAGRLTVILVPAGLSFSGWDRYP